MSPIFETYIDSMLSVVEDYGLDTVQEYMLHIRSNAESSVRKLLLTVAKQKGNKLSAVDFLDDGSPVCCLSILL